MNLKIATLKWLSVAVFTAVFATSAMADDDVSISAGVRLWNNQWQANSFPLTQAGVTVASHADSGSTLATIPVVSLRYKDFGLSASQFIEKSYTLSDGAGSADNKRSETDVNLSYALNPRVVWECADQFGIRDLRNRRHWVAGRQGGQFPDIESGLRAGRIWVDLFF